MLSYSLVYLYQKLEKERLVMKLKKTRKQRKCYSCKSLINKGDLYGQKSISLGEKEDGKTESFNGTYFVAHQMRIPVSMCECCLKPS